MLLLSKSYRYVKLPYMGSLSFEIREQLISLLQNNYPNAKNTKANPSELAFRLSRQWENTRGITQILSVTQILAFYSHTPLISESLRED